jgi:MGT family glycosyltransferase
MPASTRPLRPVAADEALADAPAWIDTASRPRVCVTMGTMPIATEAVLPWVAAAFEGFDGEVIVTTGPLTDPSRFGASPENVRFVPYVPMSRLLPTCAAVVFHAGSGTMLAALAAGLPMVLLPVGADQPANAERCVAAGVGVHVSREEQEPAAVRAAVETVLGDPRYREAALRVKGEIEAMPSPVAVVGDLDRIADRTSVPNSVSSC